MYRRDEPRPQALLAPLRLHAHTRAGAATWRIDLTNNYTARYF